MIGFDSKCIDKLEKSTGTEKKVFEILLLLSQSLWEIKLFKCFEKKNIQFLLLFH